MTNATQQRRAGPGTTAPAVGVRTATQVQPPAAPASAQAVAAAKALRVIRTAPTLRLGLAQLDSSQQAQLGLNPSMDLQAIVVTLATSVGYGPLDSAYRLVFESDLMNEPAVRGRVEAADLAIAERIARVKVYPAIKFLTFWIFNIISKRIKFYCANC